MPEELEFEVYEYGMAGGECDGHYGRVPFLVIECLAYLLEKHKEDPKAAALLNRLQG